MTEQDYIEYLNDGKKLFNLIGDDLNKISAKYIRFAHSYRDERDFKEICVALGMLANILGTDNLESIE